MTATPLGTLPTQTYNCSPTPAAAFALCKPLLCPQSVRGREYVFKISHNLILVKCLTCELWKKRKVSTEHPTKERANYRYSQNAGEWFLVRWQANKILTNPPRISVDNTPNSNYTHKNCCGNALLPHVTIKDRRTLISLITICCQIRQTGFPQSWWDISKEHIRIYIPLIKWSRPIQSYS